MQVLADNLTNLAVHSITTTKVAVKRDSLITRAKTAFYRASLAKHRESIYLCTGIVKFTMFLEQKSNYVKWKCVFYSTTDRLTHPAIRRFSC